MTPKWYFVPKESHAGTLRGLISAVGTQLHHLFWQEPAALLSVSKSFSLAVSFLPLLKSVDPMWPLFPCLLFPTYVLPTKIQVEPQHGYETEAINKSSKQTMRSQALGTESRVSLTQASVHYWSIFLAIETFSLLSCSVGRQVHFECEVYMIGTSLYSPKPCVGSDGHSSLR